LGHALRIGAIHVLVLGMAFYVRHQVTESTWGRNIQTKHSFRVPHQITDLITSSPETLPERSDVLIFEGMHPESTTISHTHVLESVHPGNREWNSFVKFMAPEYDKLSSTLQQHIRRHMFETVQQESRRFLMQNEGLNWTTVSPDIGHIFIHKSLLQRSNRTMNHLIQSLDDLFYDARNGYWRNTVLYQKHIFGLLSQLQMERIDIPLQRATTVTSHRYLKDTAQLQKFPFLTTHLTSALPAAHVSHRVWSSIKCGAVPCRKNPMQSLSWLNVGDIVEATFGDGEFIGKQSHRSFFCLSPSKIDLTLNVTVFQEWYRCTIISVNTNRNVWNVQCDDGEIKTNVCRKCVRPFVVYDFNETIDVRVGPDEYSRCTVMSTSRGRDHIQTKGLLYDVKLAKTNETLFEISAKDLRRNYRYILTRIPIHSHIIVMLREEITGTSNNFSVYESIGQIMQYHASNNTYDVLFDDGEVLYDVSPRHIKFITS
jgi:hypothetical protein